MKKYQTWIFAAVGVVIVAIVALLVKNSQPAAVQKNSQPHELPVNRPAVSPSSESRPGELVGILKDSDNVERGNLMLVMSNRSVYLNTLRDFQALVGKRVVLKIDGTLQSFRLINITAAP